VSGGENEVGVIVRKKMDVSADRIECAFAFVAWETTRTWLAKFYAATAGSRRNEDADSGGLRDHDLHTAGAVDHVDEEDVTVVSTSQHEAVSDGPQTA